MARKIFVNLPVKDLKRSVTFFTRLGFTFDSRFTDENATCMVISKDIYAMLLVKRFFKTFIKKEVCDARRSTEVLLALFLDSRKEVDEMVRRALASGGKESREAEDYGWMYGRAFEDPDGHIWEAGYMNRKAIPAQMRER